MLEAYARVWTGTYKALQRATLHVTLPGKCRGSHQRPVLTPPAWKLFSDKRPGSSKGGNSGGDDDGPQQPRLGQGTPAWKQGPDWWQTGRRSGADPGVGVHSADLLSASDTSGFPDRLILLLCQTSNSHGAWSYKICRLPAKIMWTIWHGREDGFISCFRCLNTISVRRRHSQ